MPRPETRGYYLQHVEGSHMSVRAGPGVVYVAIKRIFDTEQAVGLAIRQMFCELTVSEAVAVHKQLGEVIGIALASAQEPSGLDGGARL